MRIVVWVSEGTWPACVDAAAELAGGSDADIVLMHVREASPPPRRASLLGPARVARAERETRQLTRQAAERLLVQAQAKLARSARLRLEEGATERIVTAAAADADYLVVGRDGDRSRLGPQSLGRHTRFVIDHAPCRVLLIWPEPAPDLGTIPPPPPRP